MLILHTDASVKSDVGVGIGWHIQTWGDDKHSLLKTVDKGHDYLLDQYTSEEAELMAIARGIKEALRHGERTTLRIRSDCRPLVKKINTREPVRDGKYIDALYELLAYVDEWEIRWVSRTKNQCADRQAHVALDKAA